MEGDGACDCGTGWKALAELQYENRSYAASHEMGRCIVVCVLSSCHIISTKAGLNRSPNPLAASAASSVCSAARLEVAAHQARAWARGADAGEIAWCVIASCNPMCIFPR